MRYAKLHELFKTMEELARILIKMRERCSAIDFNLPESVFEFDDERRVAGVLRADRNIAHRIIDSSLLANETVPAISSVCESPALPPRKPQPQRVIEFAELAAAYGYKFPVEGVSSKDFQRLSHQLSGKPEERVLSYAMLRVAAARAISAQNTMTISAWPRRSTRTSLPQSAATGSDRASRPARAAENLAQPRATQGGGDRYSADRLGQRGKPAKKQPRGPLAPIPLGELELIAEESRARTGRRRR